MHLEKVVMAKVNREICYTQLALLASHNKSVGTFSLLLFLCLDFVIYILHLISL